METHNCSDVGLFLCAEVLLVVSLNENGQEQSFNTEGRLDNVRNVSLVGLGVKVIKRLAAGVDVLCEVVVCSVSNAPQLAPSEREQILKVCCSLGVEAKLLCGMVTQTQVLFLDVKAQQEVLAERSPILEPLKVCARLAEELKLHLLELTHAVSGRR